MKLSLDKNILNHLAHLPPLPLPLPPPSDALNLAKEAGFALRMIPTVIAELAYQAEDGGSIGPGLR